MAILKVAYSTLYRLLMRVDNSAGKGTSAMDKFGSVIDRKIMELGSNLNSLKTEIQLLKSDCCRLCHLFPKGWCGG
jgi:tRNA U34 5-carboxymethylaminomethyl modifying enzyme MnmG/GidA